MLDYNRCHLVIIIARLIILRITAEYNLDKLYPDLVKEWHPTRNAKLKSYDVTPRSNKKVWWKCTQGHEWIDLVSHRTNGRGCPYCSGRRVGKDNNLAVRYPELAKQWHPTKNNKVTPQDVMPRSHKKVWWICNRGHEWKATALNRSNGTGCPYCHPKTSRLEIRLYCEFIKLFNEVQWRKKIDGTECDIYLPKYKVGIELDGYPWHKGNEERDKQKGETLLKKGIILFHIRHNKLQQITQTDIFYNSKEKHIATVNRILENLLKNIPLSIEEKQRINQYLTINQLQNTKEYKKMVSFLPSPIPAKSLAQLFPKLANEWNFEKNKPLNPSMFFPKSHIKMWWKCDYGHEWKASIDNRTAGSGCPYCSGKRVGKDNNLAVRYPELAKQWHPTKNEKLTPQDVMPGSHKKVWWICNRGHEWKATAHSRSAGTGCPYCAGKRVGKDNNLAIKRPELAKQWHPTKNNKITPDNVTLGSGKKVWWKCNQGHEWKTMVAHRTRGTGCPYCAGKRKVKPVKKLVS